ncbi:DJ-1/PfpI family protein [Fodinicola acaciae]|uniref:DJ-1/PfpI family protein n=1 Tax=Fodinicola acaciae TaxID=2681555 RepID=UPI001C9E901C|nr:DJ-1/PfpI family protein [Fodinicola acaciae]
MAKRRDLLRSAAVAAGTSVTAAAIARTVPAAAAAAPGSSAQAPLRVHLLMFEGVEELDYAAPYDVLSHANRMGRPIEVSTVAVDRPGTVVACYGTRIEVSGRWAPRTADLILVPGGGYGSPSEPGVAREVHRGVIPAALAAAKRPGLVFASVCTGTMLLSAAGLTRGRPCTTHHLAKQDLAAQGGKVVDARVVDDGDLVTAGGITSGLDLALHLLQRTFGSEAALHGETILEYERRGIVWKRD